MRPSKSLPNQGLIKLRTTTLNQNNQAVQVQIGNLVARRQSGEAVIGDRLPPAILAAIGIWSSSTENSAMGH